MPYIPSCYSWDTDVAGKSLAAMVPPRSPPPKKKNKKTEPPETKLSAPWKIFYSSGKKWPERYKGLKKKAGIFLCVRPNFGWAKNSAGPATALFLLRTPSRRRKV